MRHIILSCNNRKDKMNLARISRALWNNENIELVIQQVDPHYPINPVPSIKDLSR